jgi:BirA family transcriptional regulator, biotin operon repressor / biotin---[acetyl-CoA-carboxylase] ligase
LPDTSLHNSPEIAFIELQSADSTNNYARWLIETANLPDKQGVIQAVYAHEQTAGKGQRARSWLSEKKANILLSLIANPSSLPSTNMFPLIAFSSLIVNQFFSKYAGEETKIKWPNDIYWKDRKAAGILIENIITTGEISAAIPKWKWTIIGIGININQTVFAEGTGNPVSLKQITGKNFDPVLLAKELVHAFDSNFHQLINGEFENIHSQYLEHLYKKNELVKLRKGNRVFQTTIKTVSTQGKLITTEDEFEFGEVEFLN